MTMNPAACIGVSSILSSGGCCGGGGGGGARLDPLLDDEVEVARRLARSSVFRLT